MYEKESLDIVKDQFTGFGFEEHLYPNPIGMWKNEQESLVWGCLNSDPAANWLEIGSFCGGSTVLMCLARRFLNAGPTVYSVDKNFHGFRGAFDRNVYRVGGFSDISTKIPCDSKDLLDYLPECKLSFAFIDGWHSFSAVLRDFQSVDKYMIDGGFVAFHDTAPQPYQSNELEVFYNRAIENFDKWTVEQSIDTNIYETKQTYHESEQLQDFLIDEAIAYIIKKYNYEYVNIPVLDGSTHFDRVPQYVHGSTSPYHGLVILRKLHA